MRDQIGEIETVAQERAKLATDKLLSLLVEHHGQEEIKAANDRQIKLLEKHFVPVDSDHEESERIKVCVLPIRDPVPTIDGIKRVVCRHYGLTHADFVSSRRTNNLVRPRQIAMYLCKELTAWSYPYIGRKFGGRDHTTVIHAFRLIQSLIEVDPKIGGAVSELRAQLT